MISLTKQLLESERPKKKVSLTLEGSPDTIDKILLLLSTMAHCGSVGSSRDINIGIDGDGHEWLEVTGNELPEPANIDDGDSVRIYSE